MRRRLAAPFAVSVAAAVVFGLLAPSALAFSTPNDPLFSEQWGMQIVGAPQAWAAGALGTGVKIGIVDTGIDLGHEDLAGKVVASTSCVGSTNQDPGSCHGSAQDDNGHGTHVAGIAAANTDNGLGVAGVAPGAELVIARALVGQSNDTASGSEDDIVAGIEWVIRQGAQVVNLSLGDSTVVSSVFGSSLEPEINKAWNTHHVVVVVAAGNNGAIFGSEYAQTDAVVVTATDRNDRVASYASKDNSLVGSAHWGMAAPGGAGTDTAASCQNAPNDIFSTLGYVNNPAQGNGSFHQYGCLAGTSMAAPHVAGAAAVLLGLGVPYNQVPDRLVSTAKPITSGGAGHGRLDLAKAVSGLTSTAVGTASAGRGAQPGLSSTTHRTAGRGTPAPTAVGTPPPTAVAAPPTTNATETEVAAPKVEAATVRRTSGRHARGFPLAAAALGLLGLGGVALYVGRRRRATP